MTDKWVAECLPCKWEEWYDSETEAIESVTEHVMKTHPAVNPTERATRKMGHVQLRTVEPQVTPIEPVQEYFQHPSTPPPDEGTGESEPAAETTPEETEIKSGRHRGRRGEAY